MSNEVQPECPESHQPSSSCVDDRHVLPKDFPHLCDLAVLGQSYSPRKFSAMIWKGETEDTVHSAHPSHLNKLLPAGLAIQLSNVTNLPGFKNGMPWKDCMQLIEADAEMIRLGDSLLARVAKLGLLAPVDTDIISQTEYNVEELEGIAEANDFTFLSLEDFEQEVYRLEEEAELESGLSERVEVADEVSSKLFEVSFVFCDKSLRSHCIHVPSNSFSGARQTLQIPHIEVLIEWA